MPVDVKPRDETTDSEAAVRLPAEASFQPISIAIPLENGVPNLKSIELIVDSETAIEPAAFVQPLSSMDAVEGDDVQFHCVTAGSPPLVVTWYRDNKPISTADPKYCIQTERNASTLQLKEATPDDIGEYRCTIGNERSQASSEAHLNVTEHPSKWTPPEFAKVPEDIKSVEGNTVRFEARLEGKPEPEVVWLKDNVALQANARRKMENEDGGTHSLTLLNCTPDDGGEYTVEAKNNAGLATCSCTLSLQDDTVLPKFVRKLHDTSAPADGPLDLTAEFVGTPEPEITWLVSDVPLVPRTGCELSTEEGTSSLLFDRLQPDDAGQYKCVARNSVGKATTSCNVVVEKVMPLPETPDSDVAKGTSVEARPSEVHVIVDDLETSPEYPAPSEKEPEQPRPPEFAKRLVNAQMFEKEDFALEVIVEGWPKPSVRWEFEGEPLVESESVVRQSQGKVDRVVIKNADLDHEGDYTCLATNDLGSCSCTCELLVEEELPQGPRFTRELVDMEIRPNKEVVLEVEVEGDTDVTWLKDGVPLENTSKYQMQAKAGWCTLRFTPTGAEDEGEYKCAVVNNDGKDTSVAKLKIAEEPKEGPTKELRQSPTKEFTQPEDVIEREEIKPNFEFPEIVVEVKNEPEFVTVPRDLTVEEDERVVIRCSVAGYPVPEVKWYNEKKEEVPKQGRVRYVSEDGYSSLVIDNAELDDEGNYICVASNPSGEVSKTVELLVDEAREDTEALKQPQDVPSQRKPVEDMPVVMEQVDKVFKEPIDVEMSFPIDLTNEQLLRSQTSPGERAPTPENVPRPVGTHPAEKSTPDVAPEQVKCTTKPRVETIRDTYTADGQNACLAVRVQGSPDTVEWFKDGEPLWNNSKHKINYNKQTSLYELTIRDCDPSDSGEYRCVATNANGQDSCPIKLDIEPLSGPPTFLRSLVDAEVLSGTSVKFIVEVVGSPTPEVTWSKDGSQLDNDAKYSIESEGITYSLTVRDCGVEDSGVFKCVGTNPAGQVECSALLTVSTMAILPPSFQDKPEDTAIEILEQGDIKLEATIVGRPKPSVEWLKNDQPLRGGSHYKIEQNNDTYKLIIVGVTKNDSASYKCIATNDGGIAERTYHVDIEGTYCLC